MRGVLAMTGKLEVVGNVLVWDTDVQGTVDAAKEEFDRVVAEGMAPVGLKGGKPVGVLSTFDPAVEEIVVIPSIIGG